MEAFLDGQAAEFGFDAGRGVERRRGLARRRARTGEFARVVEAVFDVLEFAARDFSGPGGIDVSVQFRFGMQDPGRVFGQGIGDGNRFVDLHFAGAAEDPVRNVDLPVFAVYREPVAFFAEFSATEFLDLGVAGVEPSDRPAGRDVDVVVGDVDRRTAGTDRDLCAGGRGERFFGRAEDIRREAVERSGARIFRSRADQQRLVGVDRRAAWAVEVERTDRPGRWNRLLVVGRPFERRVAIDERVGDLAFRMGDIEISIGVDGDAAGRLVAVDGIAGDVGDRADVGSIGKEDLHVRAEATRADVDGPLVGPTRVVHRDRAARVVEAFDGDGVGSQGAVIFTVDFAGAGADHRGAGHSGDVRFGEGPLEGDVHVVGAAFHRKGAAALRFERRLHVGLEFRGFVVPFDRGGRFGVGTGEGERVADDPRTLRKFWEVEVLGLVGARAPRPFDRVSGEVEPLERALAQVQDVEKFRFFVDRDRAGNGFAGPREFEAGFELMDRRGPGRGGEQERRQSGEEEGQGERLHPRGVDRPRDKRSHLSHLAPSFWFPQVRERGRIPKARSLPELESLLLLPARP